MTFLSFLYIFWNNYSKLHSFLDRFDIFLILWKKIIFGAKNAVLQRILSSNWPINVDHFKIVYPSIDDIHMLHIVLNYLFITFIRVLKKFCKILLIFMIFWHIFEHIKNFTFFEKKHAVLQRTLNLRFFHQHRALQSDIPTHRDYIHLPYCKKCFFHHFCTFSKMFQQIFTKFSHLFHKFSKKAPKK